MSAINGNNKGEKLYDAITDIRDDIVTGAEIGRNRGIRGKAPVIAAVAAAIALLAAGAAVMMPLLNGKPAGNTVSAGNNARQSGEIPFAVVQAQYPKMASYPDETEYIGRDGEFDSEGFDVVYEAWRDSINAQRRENGYADGLNGFFAESTEKFLSSGGDTNRVYSPLNVYMALAMLAETAGGDSRRQIMDTLGCSDIESLRSQASDVWNASYRDDGAVASVMANSVWLSDSIGYNTDTLGSLADNYYASSFSGRMGSEEYDEALRAWLNEQTGGLLEQQAGNIRLSPETMLTLASTVYFRSKWTTEYNPNMTKEDIFHGAAGDTAAQFMPMSDADDYFWDDHFSAIYRGLESGGRMWFILPDEDTDIRTVLGEGRYMELVSDSARWKGQKRLTVNSRIPKFDITSETELSDGLRELGITDIFDAGKSDFSPISADAYNITLDRAQHDARVAIDEEGVIAVAYTVMQMCGAAMPPEEQVDFIVDRPFIFVIATPDGLPMFVGAVYDV